jgi:hypothetical protein
MEGTAIGGRAETSQIVGFWPPSTGPVSIEPSRRRQPAALYCCRSRVTNHQGFASRRSVATPWGPSHSYCSRTVSGTRVLTSDD